MDPAPVNDGLFATRDSIVKSTAWRTWFAKLSKNTLTIYTGILAPSLLTPPLIPDKVGDIYIDTVAAKVYIAAGTPTGTPPKLAVTDWRILN